jgi:hypothetical protein
VVENRDGGESGLANQESLVEVLAAPLVDAVGTPAKPHLLRHG